MAERAESRRTSARLSSEGVVSFSTCFRTGDYEEIKGEEDDASRPIAAVVGYEVAERRSKFTVYKVQVRNPHGMWTVFRRYTDFVRLDNKLKASFPWLGLSLPPKRRVRDNFQPTFLDARQSALHHYLCTLSQHKGLLASTPVREFLCLDDPPGPFDSLEESRAFCDVLAEENVSLRHEIIDKGRALAASRRHNDVIGHTLAETRLRLAQVEDQLRVYTSQESEGQQQDG